MIKQILVLVPDQVKLIVAEDLPKEPQRFLHQVECNTTYQSPKEQPEKPNIDLRPRSEEVGASAKSVPQPPAAKSRPQSPAPKAMPSSSSSTARHPPTPPLSPRMQAEGGGRNNVYIWPRDRQWHRTDRHKPQSTLNWNQWGGRWDQEPRNKGRGKGRSKGRNWSRRSDQSWTYYPR